MHIYNIGRIRQYLTTDTTKTLVQALVTSRLDYANSSLYDLPTVALQRLQKTQNHAARLITRTRKRDHISPVLRELHWLTIEKRITFKMMTLTHKCVYGGAPSYLRELTQHYEPGRDLRSADDQLLTVQRTQSRYGDRSFQVASAKLWNALPPTLRKQEDHQKFRRTLKFHLFNE